MDESLCPICGEAIPASLLKLHMKLEKNMIREKRETNPEWFQDDGDSTKCIEEYKKKHQRVREEAREIRAKASVFNEIFTSNNGDGDIDNDEDN
jgi:hypothetical protein